MEHEEYVDPVRLHLGCDLLRGGRGHARTQRGHNAVTTLVHAAAQSCDCTAEMDFPGLTPGTDLGNADVLTSALGNSPTALDISICSPHAQRSAYAWAALSLGNPYLVQPERVPRHGRDPRDLLRGGRGNARAQRGHHAGSRSSSVL